MSRSTGMCESDQARMGMHAFAAEAAPTGPTGSRLKPLLQAALTGRSHTGNYSICGLCGLS
jgi:hypothetical protein